MGKKPTIRAGQFYAAKYQGDNGDLIVGQVKSVRTTGEVVLINLLTGKIATKKAEVLQQRNKRISKAQMMELMRLALHASKAEVRSKAVDMRPFTDKKEKPPVVELGTEFEEAVSELRAEFYEAFSQLLWNFLQRAREIATRDIGKRD